MTADRITEIETREQAATKGPWGFYDGETYADVAADLEMTGQSSYSYRQKVAQLEDEDFWDDLAHEGMDEDRASEQMAANAAFIANARTDVPWLIEQLQQARRIAVELENENARLGAVEARTRDLAEVWKDAPDPLARAMAVDLITTLNGPRNTGTEKTGGDQ